MTERMTTHEGAPMPTHPEVVTLDPNDMSAVLRLREFFRARGLLPTDRIDDWQEALQEYAKPPIPEEPPEWTVVRAGDVVLVRQAPTARRASKYRWWRVGTEEVGRDWPEVCALGTPEVLEPDSVKALRAELSDARERAGRYAADANLAESKVEQAETERNAALSILADVEERARAWTEKDAEPADDRGLAILSTINRLGREILHLLDAAEDEPAEPAPVEVTEEPPVGSRVKDKNRDIWERDLRGWFIGDAVTRAEWNEDVLRWYGPLTLVETGGQS